MKRRIIPALQGAACAIALSLIFVGCITVLGWTGARNTTDPENGRSGLAVFTDALTGCQYVSAGGGLFPRLGREGRPMCKAMQ